MRELKNKIDKEVTNEATLDDVVKAIQEGNEGTEELQQAKWFKNEQKVYDNQVLVSLFHI